ncbi:hypothetical protein [Pseudonocardia abyssalis]|uniref:Uncharacterized protein n=1 Tax=Pseudonocardia abyssalis TaxID=2792008 RepID=A0ABS6URH2_9PSEU|nr:hypothetical protein [Pseudonocardia abyssalis]MBW0113719.1 hypothetical protein [Pseudonocardia abyssalis]MBW0134792.1 hypothetical protein [Pseudonocardia abyssalis]
MPIAARQRAQAIAARRGGRHTLAVPLAPRLAAKIAERPYPAFLTDPTQLTNGLGDLLEAVRPDGVAVTVADEVGDPAHREAALEATRRLRATVGDGAVLLAVLPASPELLDHVKAFLEAGIDGIVLTGEVDAGEARTIGNVTRFHRAMAHVLGAGASGLPGAELVALDAPAPKEGLVLTDCGPDTRIPDVQDWLAAVRGA